MSNNFLELKVFEFDFLTLYLSAELVRSNCPLSSGKFKLIRHYSEHFGIILPRNRQKFLERAKDKAQQQTWDLGNTPDQEILSNFFSTVNHVRNIYESYSPNLD